MRKCFAVGIYWRHVPPDMGPTLELILVCQVFFRWHQAMTRNISEEETETAIKGMKCGKAVGADEIPAEAWKCMGNFGIMILCKLFNCIMNTEQMPSAWRQSILIPSSREKVTSKSAKIAVVSNSYHTLLKYGRELWIGGRDNVPIYTKVSLGSCQVGAQQMRFSYWNRQLRNTEKDRRTLEWHL